MKSCESCGYELPNSHLVFDLKSGYHYCEDCYYKEDEE